MFPLKLPQTCIKMATSERGVCPKCGAPWARVIGKDHDSAHNGETDCSYETGTTANRLALLRQQARKNGGEFATANRTLGWWPTCECRRRICQAVTDEPRTGAAWMQLADAVATEFAPIPAVVLDPFSGMATSGKAALSLGRSYIGIELNESYAELSRGRLAKLTEGRLL
jgi:hypothetical protein